VPNIYRAFLNPQDMAAFEPIRAEVEREMANYLTELAQERSFSMLEHPRVLLAADQAVPRRTIQVVAETAAGTASDTMSSTQVIQAAPQSAPQKRARLLLQTPGGIHAIPLESTLMSIGRGLNNDIILEDTRVSRHHAQLRYRSRRFWIADLGSTNGTFLNGERVTERALRNDDTISLGGLELTFKEA
jgi:pSer/pThr/pTyr-binding forkhead associated (FHA) protein